MTVLSYFELAEEDQPPERIWLDQEAIVGHFENVKAKRKPPTNLIDIEDVGPMTDNEAQADEIRRLRGERQ